MKVRWKSLCSFLIVLMVTACQSLGVSTQPTAPGEINSITEVPSPTPGQITFPEMTGTAQAIPTVIYPTETPMPPEELFDLSQSKSISPDGNYVITCDFTYPTLFYAPTKAVISTANTFFDCNSQYTSWAPDSSYVFLGKGITQDLYRWRVDGSQPQVVNINTEPNPPGVDCNMKFSWSSDPTYLAIEKNCGLYVVKPNEESSFEKPLSIELCGGCFLDFRWATSHVLMVEYFRAYGFVHIPSGNAIGALGTSGGMCTAQIPLISPDEHWMIFDLPWCGGGEPGPNQFTISNLEDGSDRVFSESFADRIDFIGWNKDSSEFYFVSRPAEPDALPDPRTPFGLLALNPRTLQVRNLFEQAWYVAFNKDQSWAYVVFPVKNDDGSLRLDGGLWQVGTDQMTGKQVMATKLDDKFFHPYLTPGTGYMYSASGQELGFSGDTVNRIVPAIWSHDNRRIAIISADRQLDVIDLNSDTHFLGQLNGNQEWLYSEIKWSDDDRSLDVDGVTWPVP